MKNYYLYLFLIILSACKSNPLVGKWTTLDIYDIQGLQFSDTTYFTDDGNYQYKAFSGDTLISELKGQYRLDSKQLIVTSSDSTFSHVIKSIDKDTLVLEILLQNRPMDFRLIHMKE